MANEKHKNSFLTKDLAAWRKWLEKNYTKEKGIWLVFGKKDSGIETVSFKDAMEEAICWGWIDSLINARDEKTYYQYFSPRNPKSNWSRVNKKIVARLTKQGRMQEPGLEMIKLAKETGTWDALNDVENLVIPEDLEKEFKRYKAAKKNFENFPRSAKRAMLEWLLNAKREETREKRIKEIAAKAEKDESALG